MTKAQIVTLLQSKCLEDTNERLVHTCEGTFSVVKKKSFGPPNNPVNDNRPNRAQTLWKMSSHVIIEDAVSDDFVWDGNAATRREKDQVLETWRLVTSRDPDRPNKKQSLYFTQDGSAYCHYDADANLIATGTLDQMIREMGVISATSLEAKFRLWLPQNGVSPAKADGYVSHLKAISEDTEPHTATGMWKGFYYDLIGVTPSKKVFDIGSLSEFDDIYSAARKFFDQDTPDSTGYNVVNYQECYDYSHDSHGGDQRTTLNAFKKYREFLGGLARFDVLASIRTKPFILLAGISGTGKSRMVRQLARGCCPEKDAAGNVHPLRDEQKPGNFEIIPVRPNWHDSIELMGYVTRITTSHKPEFVIKPFVRFLAKAMVYKDVPFFLCLDEMNLAPVEQYFAEYLSAVETRKKTANGIVSEVLVNFDLPEIDVKATVKALMKDWIDIADDDTFTEKIPNAKAVYDAIVADKGLRIPPNLVVMGTVNMDETTCSFSRKVLDRAMTFELNEVNMDEGLASDNSITYGSIPAAQAFATDVEGCDFYTANQTLCDTVKTYLLSVNAVLDDTPFKFAYRSRNEIMLYCVERTKGGVVSLARALDEATSMKILSRIEGDDQKLLYVGNNPAYKDKTILDALKGEIAAALRVANGGTEPTDCTVCAKKLDFMARRLDGGFTNFFV